MALDIQQRSTQHGNRRHHTRYETENGCVVLQADPIKNGGITCLSVDRMGVCPYSSFQLCGIIKEIVKLILIFEKI